MFVMKLITEEFEVYWKTNMVTLFSNFDYTEQQSQVNDSAAFESMIPEERVWHKFCFVVLHFRNKPSSCFISRSFSPEAAIGYI